MSDLLSMIQMVTGIGSWGFFTNLQSCEGLLKAKFDCTIGRICAILTGTGLVGGMVKINMKIYPSVQPYRLGMYLGDDLGVA